MHISLTPELEARVRAKVDSGLYNNASEVIREALRFMESSETLIEALKLAALRGQLQLGMDQLNLGEGVDFSSKEAMEELIASVKQ